MLGFNVAEPGERSDTVTTVVMSNGHDPMALQRYCKEKCGVVLGVGIGELAGQAFRIAHMGHVNAPMILGTLGVIEVGLQALGIPHGKGGTEAAMGRYSLVAQFQCPVRTTGGEVELSAVGLDEQAAQDLA